MNENSETKTNSANLPFGVGGFEIIAAIDIINGKCVRLTQGNYEDTKIYHEDPLEVAKEFEKAGIKHLHLVDLDGAKEGRVKNWDTLKKIASKTSMIIDFGGGIKTEEDLRQVFESGADIATIGTMAVKNRKEFLRWVSTVGTDKFLIGADIKENKIAVQGWTETAKISIDDFISSYLSEGLNWFFCTDVSKDGMLSGSAVDLYQRLIKKFPELNLIASGGITSVKEIEELKNIGCKGAIIGKAIYEEKITLEELKPYLNTHVTR